MVHKELFLRIPLSKLLNELVIISTSPADAPVQVFCRLCTSPATADDDVRIVVVIVCKSWILINTNHVIKEVQSVQLFHIDQMAHCGLSELRHRNHQHSKRKQNSNK